MNTTTDVTLRVKQFFCSFPSRVYNKDHMLLRAEEVPQYIYYIESGKVRQYDISDRGDAIVLNIFKEKAFFPLSYPFTGQLNKHYFSVDSNELRVYEAPIDDVMKFLKKNPDVVFDLVGRLYKGLDGVLGRMTQLMSGSAKQRVVYEILLSCHRFGTLADDHSYTVHINESDIAARTGLARETVSRVMAILKKELGITIARNTLTVKDESLLEKHLS